MSTGKKVLTGFLSTLSWLVLALAVLATSANFIVNGLSHTGETASTLIENVASSPKTLNSIIDAIAKDSDAETRKQIEKNRATIDQTLASLGGSAEFRGSIATVLDSIAQAVLNGDNSVKIDFSTIAAAAAKEVNAAAKSTVITKKDLAKIVPTTLDLSKQSKVVKQVKSNLHLALLLWILWLILILIVFRLRGKKVVRTVGLQLFSIGLLGLFIRFGAPVVANKFMNSSTLSDYQKDLIPKVFKLIAAPALNFGIIVTALGALLFLLDFFTQRRRMNPTSITS